jgi:hypothetical protein
MVVFCTGRIGARKDQSMKRNNSTIAAAVVLCLALILHGLWVYSTTREVVQTADGLPQVRDSLALLHRAMDSLKAQAPGLGEYMSTIQLHTAKLWFAAHAANWKLAKYEHDELEETIEAVEALRAKKNSVELSPILQSVRANQLPLIRRAIEKPSLSEFKSAYSQTLAACNGCHQATGYEFIHIITPARDPVTNQQWRVINQ